MTKRVIVGCVGGILCGSVFLGWWLFQGQDPVVVKGRGVEVRMSDVVRRSGLSEQALKDDPVKVRTVATGLIHQQLLVKNATAEEKRRGELQAELLILKRKGEVGPLESRDLAQEIAAGLALDRLGKAKGEVVQERDQGLELRRVDALRNRREGMYEIVRFPFSQGMSNEERGKIVRAASEIRNGKRDVAERLAKSESRVIERMLLPEVMRNVVEQEDGRWSDLVEWEGALVMARAIGKRTGTEGANPLGDQGGTRQIAERSKRLGRAQVLESLWEEAAVVWVGTMDVVSSTDQ